MDVNEIDGDEDGSSDEDEQSDNNSEIDHARTTRRNEERKSCPWSDYASKCLAKVLKCVILIFGELFGVCSKYILLKCAYVISSMRTPYL